MVLKLNVVVNHYWMIKILRQLESNVCFVRNMMKIYINLNVNIIYINNVWMIII